MKRELLSQMKRSFGNKKPFEIKKLVDRHIGKLKMMDLMKVKRIQSDLEAQIKTKLNLFKRRKFSLNKKKDFTYSKRKPKKNWLKNQSQDQKPQSMPKHKQLKDSGEQVFGDDQHFVNLRTPDGTASYVNSGSLGQPDHSDGRRKTQRESFMDTLTKVDQSQMISNLSKLTKKNVINRLSQSKDLFSMDRKNKDSTFSRETRVKRFGAGSRPKHQR